MKSKYQKFTGELLNVSQIKINKTTKEVSYSFWQHAVLVSTDKQFVVENRYGGFEIFNRKKERYSTATNITEAKCYEMKMHSTYFPDEIIATSVSFLSKKVNDRRVQKALYAFLDKEYGFYNGMSAKVAADLKELIK